MKQSIKNIFNAAKDMPLISLPSAILTGLAVAGGFAVINLDGISAQVAFYHLIVVGMASPFVTPILGATGALGAIRSDRPALSRAFSAAAATTAVTGMVAFDANLDQSVFEESIAFFYSGIAMTGASWLNMAAHVMRKSAQPPAPKP